jgi:hypothetical protein
MSSFPLRNSIFQDGFLTTNQLVFYVLYILWTWYYHGSIEFNWWLVLELDFTGNSILFFWLRSIFQRCSIVAFTQLNLGIWPVGPVAPPQVKLPSQGRSVFAISLQKLTICGRFVDSMLGSSEISHEHIPHGWYKINHLMYPMKYHHQMVNYWAMWLTRQRRESLQAGKAQRLAKINGQTQRKGTPTDR